jgi:hypothetical protein
MNLSVNHFIFYLCLSLFLGFNNIAQAAKNNDFYQKSLEKALHYLQSYPFENDVGSLFLRFLLMPREIKSQNIPERNAFARLFGEKFRPKNITLTRMVNSKSQLDKKMKKNINQINNFFYRLPKDHQNTFTDIWDDILIKSLYCDLFPFDKIDHLIFKTLGDGNGGYLDTHKIIAILFLEGNKCNDKNWKNEKKQIALNIINSLDKNPPFGDLYAERVVCLFWVGFGHKVKPQWIEKIVQHQKPDGSWSNERNIFSNNHTTALAALAIKYYLADKNNYIFYSKHQKYKD